MVVCLCLDVWRLRAPEENLIPLFEESPALDQLKEDGNDSYNKQYVNKPTGTVNKNAKHPANDKNDSDEIQKIVHDVF